jgi:N-acetylglutamate synthase-like GNAT family acetyltransferase
MQRIIRYSQVSTSLAVLSNQKLQQILADGKTMHEGIGTQIISMIDDVAKNKSLPKIFVDTYEFQAQAFYEKH